MTDKKDGNDRSAEAEVIHDGDSQSLALPNQIMPSHIYLFPVNNRPFFPSQVQPVVVSAEHWESTLAKVGETPHRACGMVFVGEIPADKVEPADFAEFGCLTRIHNPLKVEGNIQFIGQGLRRFRIRRWLSKQAPFYVEIDYPEEEEGKGNEEEVKAYSMALINAVKELVKNNPLYGEELKQYLENFNPRDPSPLADFAATMTTAKGEALQDILSTVPLLPRMKKVLPLLQKELQVARLQSEISGEVNKKISERQRDFFLREQLKTIQEELGITKDDRSADADLFRGRLEKLHPPEEVMERIEEELRKLAILEKGSPEYGVTRNYLDWSTSVPWGIYSDDKLDIVEARRILDRDHDALDDVKDRIIEFLAVGTFKKEVAGSIMLLVGPPGVGKTSIGKSVAEALGRRFFRFSLGGMRDEAEIKGHRRTYIGAMPGKLVQALKVVKVANPVIMLDEVDKIGASFQGDPASALLEVLDPEQNSEFLDHYLDMRLDLSKVLFMCTANLLDTIPAPLLDRMEMIRLSGYITEEKMAIARNHLLPRALAKGGLKKSQLKISDAALRIIIEGYAREAGVRKLEKQLLKIMRKTVVWLLRDNQTTVRVSSRNLEDFLGKPVFRKEKRLTGIGVVTGLAWTALGGATLAVEATCIHEQRRGFKQTGQLGDVMRESSEIAYSYIAANIGRFGGDKEYFASRYIHLHVPEGATPKDGPSAGITMASALLLLARGMSLERPLAMTGELTLTGTVLPVGGIKEKVIAAKRQKIQELVLPEGNRGDFEELPEHVRRGLQVDFVDKYQQVAKIILGR
ncbi:MAG: endopeptidase La [Desulfurivibrionaceae bacterium]|nr:endopeptidase La [Desulfobulbales bacterium]MDT8334569.1 endopeptidase La [Desulfurivibrionaceae bacterium]